MAGERAGATPSYKRKEISADFQILFFFPSSLLERVLNSKRKDLLSHFASGTSRVPSHISREKLLHPRANRKYPILGEQEGTESGSP